MSSLRQLVAGLVAGDASRTGFWEGSSHEDVAELQQGCGGPNR